MATPPRPERITKAYIDAVCARLAANKPVRRRLPQWGRIHIDRQLPFLCVYRRPPDADPDPGTEELVMGEASYLTASGDPELRRDLAALVRRVARTLSDVFGAFLVLEIWAARQEPGEPAHPDAPGAPGFRVFAPRTADLRSTLDVLERSLREAKIRRTASLVDAVETGAVAARGMPDLVPRGKDGAQPFSVIGLEVRPIYRNAATGDVYPLLQHSLHHELSRAVKRTFFEFTRTRTTALPPHYQALGRRSVVKAVWEVDRVLAEISSTFDFLLSVTPVNTPAAWNAFQRSRFEREPTFVYRPLPIVPGLLKRALHAIPIERIEDPVLAQLFNEKQTELDRQLTAIAERETRRFLYASLLLFDDVDDALLSVAKRLLTRISPRAREVSGTRRVTAATLARRATEEIAYYRRSYPPMSAKVHLRDDISSLFVSHGNLLIPREIRIPASRLEALIQHEVGTHVLTYFNGRAQPFRQLYSGLAGYEELQEGMAVLAEYLVGGLSAPRLRLLGARVVAVRALVGGASFVETFRELHRKYGFTREAAFSITTRVYRGGGLTKDAIYLRGILRVLQYLRRGGDIEPLFIGKIGADHVSVIRELRWRKVLRPAPLRPRYLDDPRAKQRLERLRDGVDLLELMRTRETAI